MAESDEQRPPKRVLIAMPENFFERLEAQLGGLVARIDAVEKEQEMPDTVTVKRDNDDSQPPAWFTEFMGNYAKDRDAINARLDSMSPKKASDTDDAEDIGEPHDESKPKEPMPIPGANRADSVARAERHRSLNSLVQARFDKVANQFGEQHFPAMVSETPNAYRRRSLRTFQKYSETYARADLDSLSGENLTIAEQTILNDAMKAARNPVVPADAPLRAIERRMPGGQTETTWYGSPSRWMSRFSGRRSAVVGIDMDPNGTRAARKAALYAPRPVSA